MGVNGQQSNKQYTDDVVIIKDFRVAKRLVYLRTQCNRNYECIGSKSPKNSVNEDKLKNNLVRARSKILEYALCNEWEWYFTATIDGKKYNRTDLKRYRNDFTRFLQRFGRQNRLTIQYLIIPELHKDGKSWHAHGFIKGLPVEYLSEFKYNRKLPKYIKTRLNYGYKLYEFRPYSERFGFNDFERIRDLKRSASYITKYITKDLGRSVSELGLHTFFASKGLKTAKEIDRGILKMDSSIEFDYECEYFAIKWLETDEDYHKYFDDPDGWHPCENTPFD
ncbi:MAG: hypothetical protein E7298_08430 [Lachnospiraceae bacterium]|nr:hypothetical protein [Lachnospiraceae bacterium]